MMRSPVPQLLALLSAALCLIMLAQLSAGQNEYYCGPPRINKTTGGCPRGWYKLDTICYYLHQFPPKPRGEAKTDCANRNSLLLRVDTPAQFISITSWLQTSANDRSLPYHTSGMLDPANRFKFIWEGHNQRWRTELMNYWLEEIPREGDGKPPEDWFGRDTALLSFNGAKWGWLLQNATVALPYICQAEAASLAASLANQRDFDYGIPYMKNVVRSPCMISQPANVIHFEGGRADAEGEKKRMATFECAAYGNPMPTYNWYKFSSESSTKIKIDPVKDKRYSITNGKLTIFDVKASLDSGFYACQAVNSHGSVLSRQAELIFGILPSFSKVDQAEVFKETHSFWNLECKLSDNAQPRRLFDFQFFYVPEDDPTTALEVRPDFRTNLFVSQATGRLYFSEIGTTDGGYYFCRVGVQLATGERLKGPNTRLRVRTIPDARYFVKIVDGFPASKPAKPMRGQNVILECMAYGTTFRVGTPPLITWERSDGKQLPSKMRYTDRYKRSLLIPNAQLEDSGTYGCRAEIPNDQTSQKKFYVLTINSGPYFVTSPEDQFADVGSSATFYCQASGSGNLRYAWLRGKGNTTEVLDDIAGLDRSRFSWNTTSSPKILTIKNLQPGDAAAYGCSVINQYDRVYGFAELKVLSFAPTFYKNPYARVSGLVSKTVFLPCDSEGAPEPSRSWLKGSTELSIVRASDADDRKCPPEARLCEMLSGKLRIQALTVGDAGMYYCVAKNKYGTANGTIELQVSNSLSFDFSPENRLVLVNSTVDLPCQLSQDTPNLDVNYAWRFENTELLFGRYDFDARRYEMTQFYRPYKKDYGTLRIANIQYDYEGNYTCIVQTPLGFEERSAYLRVAGPPGPCAGVVITSVTSEVALQWRRGADHQSAVTSYIIELQMEVEQVWRLHATIPESDDIVKKEGGQDLGWRQAKISGLPFYHRYRLRVAAVNEYGIGEPSPPSDYFVTESGPPSRAPTNVTGGGGKVKTLVVRWREVDTAYQGGRNFTYDIEYKRSDDADDKFLIKERLVGKKLLDTPNHLEEAIKLSGEDTFYKKYLVRVRGACVKDEIINDKKLERRLTGPWSTSVEIFSAEQVPNVAPININVEAFNATAVTVTWEPPINYDGVSGNILGYRVVYWPKISSCDVENNADKVMNAQRLTVFGKVTTGLVIGLEPDSFYCFTVQVYNSAGDGAESSWRDIATNRRPPADFPTNVVVHSTGQFSTIRVTWNGIRQQPGEESVAGYMVRYWITGAPATNFTDVPAGLSNEVQVRKLSSDVRYDLRVYGYSSGGIGVFSSPMVQFMIVPKDRCVPGASWEAPDIKYVFVCSSCRAGAGAMLAAAAAAFVTVITAIIT